MDVALIQRLATKEAQDFIAEHESADENKISLKYKTLFGLPFALIAQQLVGRRKSKNKLPTWYNTKEVVFPPTINLEQCSSQATARFKANWIENLPSNKDSFLDLTGGFGVDSFFFSQIFRKGVVVEPNAELLPVTTHNHHKLGAQNLTYHCVHAEDFLKTNALSFDLLYVDPSRRSEAKKVFKLADCVPNVVTLQQQLMASACWILVKASPLLDIQQALRELAHVQEVVVLAVDNEVKELLFLQNQKFAGETNIRAVNLQTTDQTQTDFTFLLSDEKDIDLATSPPKAFLYEPHATILKAGAFKSIAKYFGLQKIHPNTHLYTSEKMVHEFFGRIFKIETLQPQAKELKHWLPNGKANVITRNYPLSPEELKRKLKLKDGGDNYVIGFSEEKRKTIAIATRIK